MATKKETTLEIQPINAERGAFAVIGQSPLILNRLSEKARHELLLPAGRRRSAAARASSLKHDPIREFEDSPYTLAGDTHTLLAIMATAFKGAMRTAALDLPGASKSQIGRLVYVEGDMVGVYGIPKLFMSITRSADMNHTPDVRTRCILPEWAAVVSISYVKPLITAKSVANLLAAGGVTAGVGDWRVEKGSGSFGRFGIVNADDPEFVRICSTGGRAAQEAAMEAHECYDEETADLLSWFDAELEGRA